MTTAVVLSAGAWSRSAHLPALRADPDVQILAVTSPEESTAASIAAEFAVPQWFCQWRQALELSPDIVVVSSPPVGHVEQVTAALQSGAHVLVEKPFALNAQDARAMHAAARQADRSLLVGFGWSATPVFRYAQHQVEAGQLGDLEHLTMHLAVNTRALLRGGTDGGWAGASGSQSRTYTDPATSAGGSAAVSMSHQLGLVCWITGQRIARVAAFTDPPASTMDLHTSVALAFAGSGSGVLSAASTQPYLPQPQWLLSMYGSDGQLRVDTQHSRATWVAADGSVTVVPPEFADGRYDEQAPTAALIARARGAAVPAGLDSELAVHVVEVTDAIYASAHTTSIVEVGQQ